MILAGWRLPEEFVTLRRLLEAPMGKQGKRELFYYARRCRVAPPTPAVASLIGRSRAQASTGAGCWHRHQNDRGDVIQREVAVFSNVKHGQGAVIIGWNYGMLQASVVWRLSHT
jgi:hypothetical protein